MHQILGLRSVFSEKAGQYIVTDNTFYGRGWRASSIPELFANIQTHLKAIPAKERWNLFYTVALCGDKKREFVSQAALVIDIDGLDQEKKAKYIPVVCSTLEIDPKQTGLVDSGNGLHFIIALVAPITEETYFEKNRRHFTAVCEKVNAALARAGLPGKADPAVFDPRRIMRLPGTINRKEGKPDKKCALINDKIVPVVFDITVKSGLPVIEAGEQIAPAVLKRYPTPDTDAILGGCDFLKWMKENPNDVRENQWYGGLSVLPRLPPNGRDLAHQYSRGHASYSETETESKIDQALQASGPRTCANLNALWGKCSGCKFFGKVTSPIMIQGEKYIKTKDTGFYTLTDKGLPGKPQFEDLRLFFEADHEYVTLGESKICLVWNGKFWEAFGDTKLENFAQEHFDPPANTAMTCEFKNLVCRTNLREEEWFTSTTTRKINFQNGVLDLDTMELLPHSTGLGFRYVLNYDYQPKAKAPAFEKFLGEIMNERKDLIDTLLQFAGYSFSGDSCWAEKCLIMTGEGSNGKSTLMAVFKELAGDKNSSSLTFEDIGKDTNRYMMTSALFNLAEETPSKALMDSSMFKNLISGGDMTIKVLYKQPFTIPNKTKLMFACNELPRTRDTTKGFFRRLLIVPFDRSFDGAAKDPFIRGKLMLELPGIFNLIIDAYRVLRAAEQFPHSETIDKQITDYRQDADTVRSWFDECISLLAIPKDQAELQKLQRLTVATLYASYKIFADALGEKPEPRPTVVRRLRILMTPPEYDARWQKLGSSGRREAALLGLRIHDGGGY